MGKRFGHLQKKIHNGYQAYEVRLNIICMRENQMKPTRKYHCINSLGWLQFIKTEHDKCWQGWEATEILIHCLWECKMVYPFEKHFGSFLRLFMIQPILFTSKSLLKRNKNICPVCECSQELCVQEPKIRKNPNVHCKGK